MSTFHSSWSTFSLLGAPSLFSEQKQPSSNERITFWTTKSPRHLAIARDESCISFRGSTLVDTNHYMCPPRNRITADSVFPTRHCLSEKSLSSVIRVIHFCRKDCSLSLSLSFPIVVYATCLVISD